MNHRRTHAVLIGLVLLLAGCSSGSTEAILLAEDLREQDSEILREALSAGSEQERLRAARAMGRIQSSDYVSVLAQAVREGERPLRLEALFALGQLGLAQGAKPPDLARNVAVEALRDADPAIIALAAEALGKLAAEGASAALTPLLGHDEPAVRQEAANALFRLRFVPTWRQRSEAPPDLPRTAVQALIDALSDAHVDVRRAAAHAFSRYGQPEAVAALTLRLDDPDEWVRLFSVRAIGRSGQPAATKAIVTALQDRDLHVRAEAVSALATLGTLDAYPPLLESDPSFHVRVALARALGAADGRESLEILQRLELDPSVSVRAAALEAATLRLGQAHAEAVRRALDDDAWPLRAAAARAAANTGETAPELIRRALRDPDVRVVTAALGSAEETTPGSEEVERMLGSSDLALRGTALSLYAGRDEPVDPLLLADVYEASAGEQWIEIREELTDALAGVEGSLSLLTRIAQTDPAPSVRGRARLALGSDAREARPAEETLPQASQQLGRQFSEDPVVVLETTKGELTVRALAREAPIHVASFVDRVNDGFYDGLVWHRVVSNFVIQGGDPRGDGWGGDGTTIRDEINPVRYVRGVVGMPKAGKDTGSCQIFITHLPTPHLDGNYTVFGVVESGLQVLDEIEVGDRILRAFVQ